MASFTPFSERALEEQRRWCIWTVITTDYSVEKLENAGHYFIKTERRNLMEAKDGQFHGSRFIKSWVKLASGLACQHSTQAQVMDETKMAVPKTPHPTLPQPSPSFSLPRCSLVRLYRYKMTTDNGSLSHGIPEVNACSEWLTRRNVLHASRPFLRSFWVRVKYTTFGFYFQEDNATQCECLIWNASGWG